MALNNIDKIQERDTCLALTFLLLLLWLASGETRLVYAAMFFLLLGMVAPVVMKPFAAFWFGLSHILGGVSSAVLFSVVYCAILMPVAFVRRCMGKDVLLLRRWKKDSGTCFVNRNHVFAAADFVNPF